MISSNINYELSYLNRKYYFISFNSVFMDKHYLPHYFQRQKLIPSKHILGKNNISNPRSLHIMYKDIEDKGKKQKSRQPIINRSNVPEKGNANVSLNQFNETGNSKQNFEGRNNSCVN